MTATRTLVTAFFLLAGSVLADAQTGRQDAPPPPVAPTIAASTSVKGVRVAAIGNVKQIRIEVYGPGGDPIYSSGYKPGNVHDWPLPDTDSRRLPDGSYACVITAIDLSGRPFVRQATILLQGGQASIQLREGEQASPAEAERVPASATNDSEVAITVAAHDGSDGLMVSTRGGLSFRSGDFFSGRDRELMRLTPEGNLGIGTRTPEAMLDVAGIIRARGGIRFSDGTIITSAKQLQKAGVASFGTATDTTPGPSVAGTGTSNKLAKWVDSAGTLTDSTFLEDASGNVFNFTGTRVAVGGQQPFFEAQRSSSGDILQRFWNTGTGGAKLRYVGGVGATSQIQFTDNMEWLASFVSNNQIGLQFRVRSTSAANSEAVLDQSAVMTLARSGNVGIGTPTPGVKLDVAGSLHVSGSAVVDGNIAAKYQDVAEWVPARQQMAAGTVVILDTTRTNAVRSATRAYDTHVAGVVSAQPGVILGEAGEDKVMVATTGRVKVRVNATRRPIRVGDLLVTSGRPGVAMRSVPVRAGRALLHRPGTIIGKALEPLAAGEGEILVLLSLQ